MGFGRGILWRNLCLPVRLGPLDGRATIFIVLAMYYWSYWTLGLCVVGIASLYWVERQGYTMPNLYRRVQVLIMGPHRPHQSARRHRSDV